MKVGMKVVNAKQKNEGWQEEKGLSKRAQNEERKEKEEHSLRD
jgi:hypothetical protein